MSVYVNHPLHVKDVDYETFIDDNFNLLKDLYNQLCMCIFESGEEKYELFSLFIATAAINEQIDIEEITGYYDEHEQMIIDLSDTLLPLVYIFEAMDLDYVEYVDGEIRITEHGKKFLINDVQE